MGVLRGYLLMDPGKRAVVEWVFLVFSVIIGYVTGFLWVPFYSVLMVPVGMVIFLVGIIVHYMAHREHKQSHVSSYLVEKIVTSGIYSKVRHPGYLGVILMYVGFAVIFGASFIVYIVAIFFIVLLVLTAMEEEKVLLERFGEEYKEYMRRVKWRFVPKVF